jgi:hypothetical protein
MVRNARKHSGFAAPTDALVARIRQIHPKFEQRIEDTLVLGTTTRLPERASETKNPPGGGAVTGEEKYSPWTLVLGRSLQAD